MLRKIPLILWPLIMNTHSLLAASFPAFSGLVQVPVGNHGTASVTMIDAEHFRTTDAYGPHSEEIILDLAQGTLISTTRDYSPGPIATTTQYLTAARGGAYLPWRRKLLSMIGDVTWVEQNLHFLSAEEQQRRRPELQAVLQYLNQFLAAEDGTAPDAVDLTLVPQKLRRGLSSHFIVEHLARQERDLLLEIFDADWRYIGGKRVAVPVGLTTSTIDLKVPLSAPADASGYVAVKLVPSQEPWSAKLAEAASPVRLLKTQTIESVYPSWIDDSTPSLALYVNYYCPGECDLQAEVRDGKGEVLLQQAITAEPPYIEDGEQFSSLYFKAPTQLLQPGQTYSYTVKLQPRGMTGNAFFTASHGSFVAGH